MDQYCAMDLYTISSYTRISIYDMKQTKYRIPIQMGGGNQDAFEVSYLLSFFLMNNKPPLNCEKILNRRNLAYSGKNAILNMEL